MFWCVCGCCGRRTFSAREIQLTFIKRIEAYLCWLKSRTLDSALFSFPKLGSDDLCQCLWINYRRPSINASQSNILRFIISIFEGKGICLFAKRISHRIAISIIFPGKDTCVYISRHWWLYGLGMRWGKKREEEFFFFRMMTARNLLLMLSGIWP